MECDDPQVISHDAWTHYGLGPETTHLQQPSGTYLKNKQHWNMSCATEFQLALREKLVKTALDDNSTTFDICEGANQLLRAPKVKCHPIVLHLIQGKSMWTP